MRPFPPPSVMQTWSTMNRLMSKSSVQVLLTLSRGVPIFLTSLTQHPSHCTIGGMSSIRDVQLKGSWHRGSDQLLHEKQSMWCPAVNKSSLSTNLKFLTYTCIPWQQRLRINSIRGELGAIHLTRNKINKQYNFNFCFECLYYFCSSSSVRGLWQLNTIP